MTGSDLFLCTHVFVLVTQGQTVVNLVSGLMVLI